MTVLSFISDYLEPLTTIITALILARTGYKKVCEYLEKRKRKKIDQLISKKELVEKLLQSQTTLIAYLGERTFTFIFLFLMTGFLILVGVLGTSSTSSSKAGELFFRTSLALETLAVISLMFLWVVHTVEHCRAVRNPEEAFKKLDERIEAERKKLAK